MNDINVINLSTYEAPIINENNREEWVEYGEDNLYYNWLIDRYRNSTTNNAAINNISRLIYGRGLFALDASRRPEQYAQMKSLIRPEELKKAIIERKMLGAAHLQIHWNKQHTKVDKIYHIPTHLIRPEKCNEDGDITGYYYSDNWEDTREFPPRRIPAFMSSKEQVEIYCIKSYAVGMTYFGEVDYQGGLPYAMLEEEISNYLINEVQNSFAPTMVVNFNNGGLNEQQREQVSNKVIGKLTGAKGQKVVVGFQDNPENKTTVDSIPLNDAPSHYEYLSKECEQKILISHTVTSPMLIGVVTDNQGFSSNADEIEIASKYFYNTAIKPLQDEFTEAIAEILAVNNISLDLYFRRLNLLDDVEEKAQKQEEDQTKLSSQLDELLSSIGEDPEELQEWEELDVRDLDLDDEDRLDAEVQGWEEELGKVSKLSQLVNFVKDGVKTGVGRPNAKSEQDQKRTFRSGDKYFKVRYRYAGPKSDNSRDFCQAMLRANKLYRREDLEQLEEKVVNAGFGHKGKDTYSIWKYKGGPRCRHKWERVTFISETAKIDTRSPRAKKISTNKAKSYGYSPKNPKEVSMKPNDMKHKGFHPDNPNKPIDAR